MRIGSYVNFVELAIAAGETTPNPVAVGAVCYSTVTSSLMRWDGAAWQLVDTAGAPTGTGSGTAMGIDATAFLYDTGRAYV
jgi:hypothetical protein